MKKPKLNEVVLFERPYGPPIYGTIVLDKDSSGKYLIQGKTPPFAKYLIDEKNILDE